MLRSEQSLTAETSMLLRDILQNKDKFYSQSENTTTETMQECSTAPLNEETAPMRSGIDVNDTHSERSDQRSVDGSDVENFNDETRLDEVDGDDAKSEAEENGFSDTNSPSSGSKEAKRARVENIITSMQHVPAYPDHEVMSEVRRPKRKQYFPQQHEGISKSRRIDNNLEDELWHLRNQLHTMENYFKQYDDGPKPPHFGAYAGLDNIHRLHQAYFANATPSRLPSELQNGHVSDNRPVSTNDKQPSSGIDSEDNGRRQSLEKKSQNGGTDSKDLNAHMSDLDDKELQQLVTCLKSKIEEAVSTIVDKELSKFFQRRNMNKKDETLNKLKEECPNKGESKKNSPDRKPTTDHSLNHILQMPDRNSSNGFRLPGRHSAFELPKLGTPDMPRAPFPPHPPLGFAPPLSYYLQTQMHPPLYSCSMLPEQTEALPLVVNTPKKKRTKVTDTRLSPRAARALLQDGATGMVPNGENDRPSVSTYESMIPPGLPTSVAIPNPSLQHSDILSFYKQQALNHSPMDSERYTPSSSQSPSEAFLKSDYFDNCDSFDSHDSKKNTDLLNRFHTDTLTPMHLRKAKLMFFYCRYPSSAILKVYFPDVQFNKNNTAQLVKWFSNFREFYYIQMEKYARQAIAEGFEHAEDLHVTTDSELFRVINLHYNRNNQIEVPEKFRLVVQSTLREFFMALKANKDSEPSWKKPIYKVIARLDDTLPEFFKSANWMDQLGDV